MSAPKEHRLIAAAGVITAVGLVALWLTYYLRPRSTPAPGAYQFAFDSTSPLPDLMLSSLLCLAALFLLKGKRVGKVLAMLCAIYLVYLGVFDIGVPCGGSAFAMSIIDITASGALNLWCIVQGLYTILKLKPGKHKSASVPTIFSR